MQLEEATERSLSFSWVASAHATFYSSYIRMTTNTARDDVTDGFTHVGDFPAGASLVCTFCMLTENFVFPGQSYATIDSLSPAVAYEVLLLAGLDGETEKVGARLSVSTRSDSSNIIEGARQIERYSYS